MLIGRHRIDDPVSPYLTWIIIVDRNTGLYAGPNDQRIEMKVFLAKLLERTHQRRYDTGNDNSFSVSTRKFYRSVQILKKDTILIPGLLYRRQETPVIEQGISLKNAEENI
jgi:hypothetical protein